MRISRKNSRVVVLLAALIWVLSLHVPAQGQTFFKTQGHDILDLQGNPILLQGVGLGGWMVPEGYMLHIPGFGSPTTIRQQIEDLIGTAATDQFYAMYEANYVAEADIEAIAEWGFNSIRLPFHYKVLYDENTRTFREEGFDLFDTFITWCKNNGLYVILDMHAAPGGQSDGNISDSDGTARLWLEADKKDLTVEIWTEIARRYANETWIVGYDLLNEPVLPEGISSVDLRNLYVRLRNAIRTVDPNHILFIEGNWYATAFDNLTPPFDDNMVYSFHKYWSEANVPSIGYLLGMRAQFNVPLWMGESGENSNPWFYEARTLFEQQNIGWNWWTHKKIDTTTSPLSAPRTPEYQQLLDYWGGNGSRPSAEFARDALFQMAENLKIENCDIRPGVIPALLGDAFNTQTVPVKELHIPGPINAVEYNVGNQGVAYHDVDYKNVGGDQTVWNTGWSYRNDGVDIQGSQDPEGFDYHVGWIEAGEWLTYTVEAAVTGVYDIFIRVASAVGGGQMQVLWDGEVLGETLTVPDTGGWENWISLRIDDQTLTRGSHRLTLSFLEGGFNLNRLNFLLISSEETPTLRTAPPYPNPFVQTVTGEFTMSAPGNVRVEIYDMMGRRIRTVLEETSVLAGPHPFTWDGTAENGGRVAAGLYFARIQTGDQTAHVKLMYIPS